MVNKEFAIGSGGIIKDFQDRNIPQNSNNFVSIGILIPTSEFDGITNYSVMLATSKVVSGVETSLPSLICYSAKTLKIEGVDYIKWQCQLSISYTNFIGQLKLTPYITETTIENEGEEDEEVVITTQKTFTNTTLNVIRSIASTNDASLEEPSVATQLANLINAKNIKLVEDYKNNTKSQAIVGCFTDYNASYYEGWLLIVKYSGGQMALLPYKNSSANEFTELDMDSKFYKLSNYSSGSYTSTQLTYTKSEVDTILTNYYTKSETYSDDEVDTLLSGKVDKTQKINGHALNGDITITKGDVGLGNVDNYDTINSPTENASTSWVNAGGLWTYLKTNYADLTDYNATKTKVNELYASFKGTGDNDNVVNTLYDLIKVFENFPEADNIASVLNGLDARLDALEELSDALITINQTIVLDADEWVSNSDTYASDYPYKQTYQNDLLKEAQAFEVIFSVNSDTSLLSSTAILDNETGTITIYASETPSADITIEKINAVNGLDAISTITTDTILQVQQNKNDIADLNTNKANKSALDKGIYYTSTAPESSPSPTRTHILEYQYIENVNSDISIKNNDLIIYLKDGVVDSIYKVVFAPGTLVLWLNKIGDYSKGQITYATNTAPTENGAPTYTLDSQYASSNIKVGDYLLYVDSGTIKQLFSVESISNNTLELYLMGQYGGGKQLYQHNIDMRNKIDFSSGNVNCRVFLTIINDNNTPLTREAVATFLYNKGFILNNNTYKDRNTFYQCSGAYSYSNDTQYGVGGLLINNSNKDYFYFEVGVMGRVEPLAVVDFGYLTDTIIAL